MFKDNVFRGLRCLTQIAEKFRPVNSQDWLASKGENNNEKLQKIKLNFNDDLL